MKSTEFQQLELCMKALHELEQARTAFGFAEWPGKWVEDLRIEMDKLWDSVEVEGE